MPTLNATHIKVPTALAHRLRRLRDEMQAAYGEGRLDVPGEYAEYIPLWYVIKNALNEVEARRLRSARPRKPSPSVLTQESS